MRVTLVVLGLAVIGWRAGAAAHAAGTSHAADGSGGPAAAAIAGSSPGRRRLASEADPAVRSCGISRAGAASQVDERVVGAASGGGMPAAVLQLQARQESAFPAKGITVDVHFHVIAFQGAPSLWDRTTNVTAAGLAAQVRVLNRDYRATGIGFRTASVSWHASRAWARDCDASAYAIAAAKVVEPDRAVNIFLCDLYSNGGNLGFALELPGPGFSQDSTLQSIFIDYKTLPGGPYTRFSGGRTMTHEVGHWAGLRHIFSLGEDACSGGGGAGGDGVADTPQQRDPSSGCPIGRDSCPDQPGLDAVVNFMDYSNDSCMREFTPGQVARMQAVLLQYRPTLVAAAVNSPWGQQETGGASSSTPPRRKRPPPPGVSTGGQRRRPPPKGVPAAGRPPARKQQAPRRRSPPPRKKAQQQR